MVHAVGHVVSSVNDDFFIVVFICEWDIPQSIVCIHDSLHYFMSLVKNDAFFFAEYDLASCLAEIGSGVSSLGWCILCVLFVVREVSPVCLCVMI